jgi:hypothetical protein
VIRNLKHEIKITSDPQEKTSITNWKRHAKISGNGNEGKKESGTNANKQLLQDWYLKNKP